MRILVYDHPSYDLERLSKDPVAGFDKLVSGMPSAPGIPCIGTATGATQVFPGTCFALDTWHGRGRSRCPVRILRPGLSLGRSQDGNDP